MKYMYCWNVAVVMLYSEAWTFEKVIAISELGILGQNQRMPAKYTNDEGCRNSFSLVKAAWVFLGKGPAATYIAFNQLFLML